MTAAAEPGPTLYIPNLNGGEMLARTLESLQPAGTRIAVVDNASQDHSLGILRERFPEVEVIALEENIGFGNALNLAVERVPGDPLIFLNNDVECEPGFVDALLEVAREDDVAAVAGVLVQRERPQLIDSAGVMVESDTLMAFDYMHGESVEALETAAAPLGPTGGAALYRRDAFQEVGGFDERIFVYYEDADLALRMRAAGHECALAPRARALHAFSATLGSRSGAKFEMTGWSRGYLLRRYGVMGSPGPALRALACESAICAGQLARNRTARGVRGRVRGWRAARGLPRQPIPGEGLVSLSVAERLRLRAGRKR